jgi:ubiquinone biosynthesis protein
LVADQLPELPLVANRLLSDLEHRQAAGMGLYAKGAGGPRVGEPGQLQAAKAIAGATLALCGTLVLLLGPGPWLQPGAALALMGGAYVGAAWLFLSAAR